MDKTNIPKANTKDELINILSQFDISVPSLGDGRQTLHVERWSICKLLSTLAFHDSLFYPLELTHDDRPDFIVLMDHTKIGIELTAARHESHAKYQAILNREFPEKIYSPSIFQLDHVALTKNEIYENLRQETIAGMPLMGDQPERDWAQYIKNSIQKKLEALAKPEFKKFNNNCLLIYVAIPFCQVKIDIAMEYLNAYLPEIWAKELTFDVIYIEHIHHIIQISPNKSLLMKINEIW